jgi:hypothetical protein
MLPRIQTWSSAGWSPFEKSPRQSKCYVKSYGRALPDKPAEAAKVRSRIDSRLDPFVNVRLFWITNL